LTEMKLAPDSCATACGAQCTAVHWCIGVSPRRFRVQRIRESFASMAVSNYGAHCEYGPQYVESCSHSGNHCSGHGFPTVVLGMYSLSTLLGCKGACTAGDFDSAGWEGLLR
jgi:hypothetical protein